MQDDDGDDGKDTEEFSSPFRDILDITPKSIDFLSYEKVASTVKSTKN